MYSYLPFPTVCNSSIDQQVIKFEYTGNKIQNFLGYMNFEASDLGFSVMKF